MPRQVPSSAFIAKGGAPVRRADWRAARFRPRPMQRSEAARFRLRLGAAVGSACGAVSIEAGAAGGAVSPT